MALFIVVEDHSLARLAIRHILEKDGHTVIAETDNGNEALNLIGKLGPDAVILDIDLSGISGIEVVKTLRSRECNAALLIMSGKNARSFAFESMAAGADAFISKRDTLGDLPRAVQAVFSGYGYFPLAMHKSAASGEVNTDHDLLQRLSEREKDVLHCLAKGMENVAIARHFGISDKSVSTYKTRLLNKLSLHGQCELVDFARRNKLC